VGRSGGQRRRLRAHDRWALHRGHPHIIDAGRHLKEAQSGGHACLPLMAHGTGLGIVYFQNWQGRASPGRDDFLSSEYLRLAVTVMERVVLSLGNLCRLKAFGTH
jgi:hypothetical protein